MKSTGITPIQEAVRIIDRIRIALANDHKRPPPNFMSLIFGRHAVERDAFLLHTIAGQASLSINPAGQLIIRSKGDPAVSRYIIKVLDGNGTWDARQRGWRIPAELSTKILARIIVDRTPVREIGSASHPFSASRTSTIIINSSYGITTGEREGDTITMRILDARMSAALKRDIPCGKYDDNRVVGIWSIDAVDLVIARTWADQLR